MLFDLYLYPLLLVLLQTKGDTIYRVGGEEHYKSYYKVGLSLTKSPTKPKHACIPSGWCWLFKCYYP